jgi:hypothetical protein
MSAPMLSDANRTCITIPPHGGRARGSLKRRYTRGIQ